MFSRLKFVIIENELIQLKKRRMELQALGVREDAIFPPENTAKPSATFSGWEQVTGQLDGLTRERGWNPKTCEIVLMLDVILGRKNHDTDNAAISKLREVLPLWQDYVVVLYSAIAESAVRQCSGLIDASISKADSGDSSDLYAMRLRNAVGSWSKRTKRPSPLQVTNSFEIRDSLAVRQITGVYGENFLPNVAIEILGASSSSAKAEVLTGGYSGAAVLRLSASTQQGGRSVILKVSRDKAALELELQRLNEATKSAHKFAAAIVSGGLSVSEFRLARNAWYLQYPDAPGMTLEQSLKKVATDAARSTELARVFEMLRVIAEAGLDDVSTEFNLSARLALSVTDLFRFEETLSFLRPILAQLVTENATPGADAWLIGLDDALQFVRNWNSWLERFPKGLSLGYLQHGDLNPRNLILVPGGGPRLIDFARYGVWPALYDLVRLELQVMRRLFDEETGLDNFPHRMNSWINAVKDPCSYSDVSPAWAAFRQRHSALVNSLQANAAGPSLAAMQSISKCYDLVKMVSYHDVSVFKRVWFLSQLIDSIDTARKLEEA